MARIAYLGRQPPASDMVGKLLERFGGIFRSLGVALDNVGVAVQGSAATKDALLPNVAWMPVKATQGQTIAVPGFTPSVQALGELSVVLPQKAENVFIAPNAHVLGNVKIGRNSSIWYGSVLRGDVNAILIGDNSNIQDNVVVHVARNALAKQPHPTIVGNNVTVAHGAVLHACTIGDNSLVGMGATLLDGTVMEPGSIVAAGALVTPGTTIPSGQIWAGSPAKFLRQLTAEETVFVAKSAENYSALAAEHHVENTKTFEDVQFDNTVYEEKKERADATMGPGYLDIQMGIVRDPETQGIVAKAP